MIRQSQSLDYFDQNHPHGLDKGNQGRLPSISPIQKCGWKLVSENFCTMHAPFWDKLVIFPISAVWKRATDSITGETQGFVEGVISPEAF